MQTFYFYPCSEEYPISLLFGENPSAYRMYGLAGHNGLDIALPLGEPVYAAADGEVILAEEHGTSAYGRQVRLNHAGGLSLYAHLSRLNVHSGQGVTAKEVIGWSGGARDDPHSGNSTGPHLHFELRPTLGGVPGYSGAVDPLPLLRSHDYNPDAKPLYQVQVVVNELNIRTRPDTKSQVVTVVGRGCEFSVLAEVDCGDMLWLRLHSPLTRYLCARQGQETYARRLLSYTSRPETIPWADSVTAFLRSLGYTGPEPQNER